MKKGHRPANALFFGNRELAKYGVKPYKTAAAVTRAVTYIDEGNGTSGCKSPQERASFLTQVREQFEGKRVRNESGATGVVTFVTAKTQDDVVTSDSNYPFLAFVRWDSKQQATRYAIYLLTVLDS